MYILRVFSGGVTYYYGPFEDRATAIAWAKKNCSEQKLQRYSAEPLLSQEETNAISR